MDEGQHTRNSLLELRAKIAGEIEALQDQTRQRIADLANVESVLHLLEPGRELDSVRPKIVRTDPKRFRGAVQGIIFDEIRRHGQCTHGELTDAVMRDRGLDLTDQRARVIVQRRVKDRLGGLKKQGRVEPARAPHKGDPDARVWRSCG